MLPIRDPRPTERLRAEIDGLRTHPGHSVAAKRIAYLENELALRAERSPR